MGRTKPRWQRVVTDRIVILASSILDACSTLEPRRVKFDHKTSYAAAKEEAWDVHTTLEKRATSAQYEDVIYQVSSIGLGVAGAASAIYGAPTDLITGFALGAASMAGWDLYWNPSGIQEPHENGAEAITCAIEAADALSDPAFKATIVSLTPLTASLTSKERDKFLLDRNSGTASEALNNAVDEIRTKLKKAIRERARDKSALLPTTILGKINTKNKQAFTFGQGEDSKVSNGKIQACIKQGFDPRVPPTS